MNPQPPAPQEPRQDTPRRPMHAGERHGFEPSRYDRTRCAECGNAEGATIHPR